MLQLLRNKLRNPNCTLCPLHKDAQHVCLIGDGPYPAELMLVGEAPGYREDSVTHKPFAGKAGKLLDSILNAFELSRNSIYISNAVKCRPISNDEENTKPPKSSISICSKEYLTKEIEYVKPKLILALGKIASQALLGYDISINKARNKIWKTASPMPEGIPVIVTYHPAAALRQDYLVGSITNDFEEAMRYLEHGDEKQKLDYKLVKSLTDIPGIDDANWVSLDLETDGFDPFLPGRSIISIQLAIQSGTAYYLRWDDLVRDEIKGLLQRDNLGLIGHNLKFDLKWLKKAGIDFKGPIHDTLLAIHLLDENMPDKSLDAVASAYTPLKAHKEEMQEYVRKHKCTFREVPLEIAVPYGCGDVDASYRCACIFVPKIKQEGMAPLYKQQMKAARLAEEIEYNGIKVDVGLIDDLADLYENDIKVNQKKLNKFAKRELNPWSPKQVKELLYDKWKLPAMGDPKKWGGPPELDTRENTMLRLIEWLKRENFEDFENNRKIDTINLILKQREDRKLLSTYILGMGDFIREDDLIHPNFLLHGTVTGRWSCRDPNLQNIPREGHIKGLFISRYGSDGVIMQVDVSQGELRLAAQYSLEPTLLAAFRSGTTDIHRKVAAQILSRKRGIPVSEDEVTKEERKKAKIVNFGILYGAWKYKMASQMGVLVDEAEEFINLWKNTYSMWGPYERKVRRDALANGFVTSLFGRIRHLPIMDSDTPQGREALRQAVNSPIQGGLLDYTVMCGLQVHSLLGEALKHVHFIAQVHDAWILDVKKEYIPVVKDFMKFCFTNPNNYTKPFGFEFVVPMDIEISVGPNWKEQTTIYPEVISGNTPA